MVDETLKQLIFEETKILTDSNLFLYDKKIHILACKFNNLIILLEDSDNLDVKFNKVIDCKESWYLILCPNYIFVSNININYNSCDI